MKTILITGIAQGIGYATTKLFLENNNKVIGTVRKLADKERLEQEFGSENLQVELCELKNSTEISNLCQKLHTANVKIDILINNAGVIGDYTKSINEANDLEDVFLVNVFAVQKLINGVLDLINPQGNVISLSTGFAHYPGMAKKEAAQYALSKSTLNSMMQIYSATISDINFNVLYPGMVKTRLGLNGAYREADEIYEMIINIIEQNTSGKCFKEFSEIKWLEPVII